MAAVQLHCVEQQERSSIVHQKSLVLSDVGTAESYSRNPPAAQNFCRIFVLCFSWVSPSSEDHHKVSHCSLLRYRRMDDCSDDDERWVP